MTLETPTESRPHALVRPRKPGEAGNPVLLLARTGGRKTIRVREADKKLPGVFGCHPWDLIDPRTNRLIDRAILNALPWEGKGRDPLGTTAEPITARVAPVERGERVAGIMSNNTREGER